MITISLAGMLMHSLWDGEYYLPMYWMTQESARRTHLRNY